MYYISGFYKFKKIHGIKKNKKRGGSYGNKNIKKKNKKPSRTK